MAEVVGKKIAINVLINSCAKALSTVLALVSVGFITRYLGTEGFGNYATAVAFLSLFSAMADLGLYNIATREISRFGADEKKIMGNVFSLRIIISASILILAPLVIFFFPYSREIREGIIIVAVAFLFSSGYQVLNGVFQKNLAMYKVAIGELTGKVVQVTTVILTTIYDWGFDWIIMAMLLNMAVSFLIIFLWSRKYIKIKLQFDFSYWKEFLKESLPMGAVAIISFVYFKMDTILLSVIKGGADVGIYNAAYKVLENSTFFPALICGLVLPIMSRDIFTNRKNFQIISDQTLKFFILLIVPLTIVTLFLSEGIIGLIGGAAFTESAHVLRILIFALALIFFGHFFNAILIVSNLQKKLMLVLLVAAIVNISLNAIAIPRFSYLGAAYVSVITELVVVSLTAYLVIFKVKYYPQVDKLAKIMFSGLIMSFFLFIFRGKNFFVLASASFVVYFLALWMLRVIKNSEIMSLISRKGVEEYEETP
jgi:O-antigen/teichoic acid export membrane protein